MSIGNLKDQGNKGNNFPYQLKTLQLLGAINDGISALPGVDHESRTSTYQAIANGVGYSIGDIIIRYDIIDLATGLIDTTIWFNDTLQTQLVPDPLPGDLTPISAPSGVTVLNGPAGAAVNIQDGGNVISIDDAGGSITVDGTVSVNGTVSVAGEVEIVNATGSPIPVTIVTPVPVINVNLDAADDQVGVYGYVNGVSTTPVPLNVNASGQVAIQGTLTGSNTTGVSGYTATAITDLVARDIIAAPGVGLFTYVTQILVTNSHASVGTLVTIQTEDGTGLYAGYAGPAGGGFSVSFPVAIKMPVANKKLQAICGTTGANVYVSASGYTAV